MSYILSYIVHYKGMSVAVVPSLERYMKQAVKVILMRKDETQATLDLVQDHVLAFMALHMTGKCQKCMRRKNRLGENTGWAYHQHHSSNKNNTLMSNRQDRLPFSVYLQSQYQTRRLSDNKQRQIKMH